MCIIVTAHCMLLQRLCWQHIACCCSGYVERIGSGYVERIGMYMQHTLMHVARGRAWLEAGCGPRHCAQYVSRSFHLHCDRRQCGGRHGRIATGCIAPAGLKCQRASPRPQRLAQRRVSAVSISANVSSAECCKQGANRRCEQGTHCCEQGCFSHSRHCRHICSTTLSDHGRNALISSSIINRGHDQDRFCKCLHYMVCIA